MAERVCVESTESDEEAGISNCQKKNYNVIIISSDSEEDCDKDDCDDEKKLECAVCLQNCVHPARLPCGHIFCFLCLKGIAHGSKCCAMCRHPIPPDYLDNPDLVDATSTNAAPVREEDGDGYQWYYEGRNGGWWQFEQRMSDELEDMRKAGITRFEMLICGALYIIDLLERVQYKKDRPLQMRRIMRDLPSRVVVKGVAGIS